MVAGCPGLGVDLATVPSTKRVREYVVVAPTHCPSPAELCSSHRSPGLHCCVGGLQCAPRLPYPDDVVGAREAVDAAALVMLHRSWQFPPQLCSMCIRPQPEHDRQMPSLPGCP